MGRSKATPLRREVSDSWIDGAGSPLQDVIQLSSAAGEYNGNGSNGSSNGTSKNTRKGAAKAKAPPSAPGVSELLVCVAGIYASFLTWALVQERITTTAYGAAGGEIFDFSIFLNTVQSAFAALTGYVYLKVSRGRAAQVFPTGSLVLPLLLVSVTSSLASPFGYASLKHVGYVTFILAKSCKLLPVMALHVSVFRKSYPLYKYAVVTLVTSGVALFTLYHPASAKKAAKDSLGGSPGWGLFLLAINLLFDGLTNSTQDYINSSYAGTSGAQMMCAQNLMSTALTAGYLVLQPLLAGSALAAPLGVHMAGRGELADALAFLARHPQVARDIVLFAACGAVGQVFIFATLSRFSSLLLVTITVTRKMLTMLLSVVWFGHRLSAGQWVGVSLVFGGVLAEAGVARWEKQRAARAKPAKKTQ